MKTILVVDDQPGVRYLLFELFNDKGYKVELAQSGYEAIGMINETEPDLVFMDMKMPGINGLDAIKEINNIKVAKKTVLMTAYDESALLERARELGVDQNVTKPFELEDIIKVAQEVLEGK